MEEFTGKEYDFNDELKRLKELTEEIPKNIEIPSVQERYGCWNLFEHNVKGNEFNVTMNIIKDKLIESNNREIKNINSLKQVYKVIEAVDKDLVKGIMLSVKAAEKASAQAKHSAFKAEKNSLDISKTIEVQSQTIKVLKEFKDQIDKCDKFENINEIWSDCQTLKQDIKSINIRINTLKDESDTDIKKQINIIRDAIDKYKIDYDKRSKVLLKKLKIAYIMLGFSISVVLINFILIILGVI